MRTSEVIKQISKCQQGNYIDLGPYSEVANIIRKAANSKRNYIHTGFQEEAEGEEPITAPKEMIFPIF